VKWLLTIAFLLALTVPAALAAPPTGKGPEQSSSEQCKAERGTAEGSRTAFAEKYGTNGNEKNAFGKCVSSKSKSKSKSKTKDGSQGEVEDQDEAGGGEAAKTCKAERGTTAASIAAFTERYGTNPNKKNAFGKCVSKNAKTR
jgi:hypothetical protein